MIRVQIDLSKPGYDELAQLLASYVDGDSIMLENIEGRVVTTTPDFMDIEVEHLDIEDYTYDVPSGQEPSEPEPQALS
jgi:hypothetical protein